MILRELAPALLLTCGLPATGKSWLGRRLADALDAEFLQSDVRRKEMFGRTPHSPKRDGYDTGRYSPDAKQRTYDSMLLDARREIEAGRAIVIDGSFIQRRWREPFANLALELRAPFCLVEMTCDVEVVKQRLEQRALDPDEPSEADWNVYEMLRRQVEPPLELPPLKRVQIESGGEFDVALARIAERLAAQSRQLSQ